MAGETVYLFQDALDSLLDYTGAASGTGSRKTRKAILGAYAEMQKHVGDELHYLTHTRIELQEPFDDGTVTYNHGTFTLTFSDTPPDWIGNARIKIDTRICDVAYYSGAGNSVVLSETLNPGADITTATTFSARLYDYPLPGNFLAIVGGLSDETRSWMRRFVSPMEVLDMERRFDSNSPWAWTLLKDLSRQGGYKLRLFGYPNADESLDFYYWAKPRKLTYVGYETSASTGTVTNVGRAVTLSGGTFRPDMEGDFLRFSASSTAPEGEYGVTNRFAEQHQILTYQNSTQVLLATTPDTNYSAVAFRVSSPIDLPGIDPVFEAFWRCCEWKHDIAGRSTGAKDGTSWTAFRRALERAIGSCDMRVSHPGDDLWSSVVDSQWISGASIPLLWMAG